MIYLDTFVFYTLFSSAVLFYGIGINKISDFDSDLRNNISRLIKMILTIMLTSLLSWGVIKIVLIPLKLVELYPLIALLIFICVNVLFEVIVRLVSGKVSSEFIISYLIVLLSISESISLLNSMIICAGCFVSFLLLWPFVTTFRNKLRSNGNSLNASYYSLLFLFLALLIIIISVFDVSWLNAGVIE